MEAGGVGILSLIDRT